MAYADGSVISSRDGAWGINTAGWLVFFALGTAPWLLVNGIFIEMPILVDTLPEGENTAAIVGAIVQIGNIGLLYIPLRYRCGLTLSRTVGAVLALCTVASALLALFCRETIDGHSVPLFSLTLLAGIGGCISKVTWFPFAAEYKSAAITAMSTGMGLSGLLVVALGVIQGVGNIDSDGSDGSGSGAPPANGTPPLAGGEAEGAWLGDGRSNADEVLLFSLHSFFWMLMGVLLAAAAAFGYCMLSERFAAVWGHRRHHHHHHHHHNAASQQGVGLGSASRSSTAALSAPGGMVNAVGARPAVVEGEGVQQVSNPAHRRLHGGGEVAAQGGASPALPASPSSSSSSGGADRGIAARASLTGFEPSPGEFFHRLRSSLLRDSANTACSRGLSGAAAEHPPPPAAPKVNWMDVLVHQGSYEMFLACANSLLNYAVMPGVFPYLQQNSGMIFWATTLYYIANLVGRYAPALHASERMDVLLLVNACLLGYFMSIAVQGGEAPGFVSPHSGAWWGSIGAPVFVFSFVNGYCSTMIPQMIKLREEPSEDPAAVESAPLGDTQEQGAGCPVGALRDSRGDEEEGGSESDPLVAAAGAKRRAQLSPAEGEALLQILGIANQVGSLSGTYITLALVSGGVLLQFTLPPTATITLVAP